MAEKRNKWDIQDVFRLNYFKAAVFILGWSLLFLPLVLSKFFSSFRHGLILSDGVVRSFPFINTGGHMAVFADLNWFLMFILFEGELVLLLLGVGLFESFVHFFTDGSLRKRRFFSDEGGLVFFVAFTLFAATLVTLAGLALSRVVIYPPF